MAKENKSSARQQALSEPMGVSQWMAHGKKYGYDKYFRNKAIEAVGGYKPWIGKDGLFERSVIIKVLEKLKEGKE